ncbi:hypothetical protein, partial [Klebsiella pneumoniae]|uniref:hypothetical protein n=1 Tax=Klebsiella pneumoniae TaxID=573 RepID=UPI001A93C88A
QDLDNGSLNGGAARHGTLQSYCTKTNNMVNFEIAVQNSRSLIGNSARIVRSDQSPNQNKSPNGLSDVDHSTNTS